MPSAGKIRAGQGEVELGLEKSGLEKGLAAAAGTLKSWSKTVASIGAGIAGAGAAITAPFLIGLGVFAAQGGAIFAASRETGIGFEQMGALAATMGGDVDVAVRAIGRMDTFLQAVADGSKTHIQALGQLKLSFADLNEASQHERLLMIADALDKVADAGQRAALKRAVLGRGAAEINLSGGRAGIEARENRARELGAVLSPADVQLAKDYNKAMKELGMVTKGIWAELGAAAAPFMTEFVTMITNILVGFRNWLNTMRPTLSVVFRFADLLVTLGTILVGVAGFLFTAGAALGGMAMLVPILIVGLKVLGIALLAIAGIFISIAVPALVVWGLLTLFPEIGDAIATAFSAVGEYMSEWGPILEEFGAMFSSIWGGIKDAIMAGDLGLAFKIAWLGIQLIWEKGMNWLKDSWFAFKFLFLNAWHDISAEVAGIFVGMMAGIAKAMVWVGARIVSIVNGLLDNLPDWLKEQIGIESLREVDETAENARIDRRAAELTGGPRGPRPQLEQADRTREREIEGELNTAISDAEIARIQADMERDWREQELADAGQGFIGKEKGHVMGGFGADAIMGLLGGDSPASRTERLANQQLEQQRLIARDIQEIRRNGGFRFA